MAWGVGSSIVPTVTRAAGANAAERPEQMYLMCRWGFWGNVSWAKKKAREYLKELQL